MSWIMRNFAARAIDSPTSSPPSTLMEDCLRRNTSVGSAMNLRNCDACPGLQWSRIPKLHRAWRKSLTKSRMCLKSRSPLYCMKSLPLLYMSVGKALIFLSSHSSLPERSQLTSAMSNSSSSLYSFASLAKSSCISRQNLQLGDWYQMKERLPVVRSQVSLVRRCSFSSSSVGGRGFACGWLILRGTFPARTTAPFIDEAKRASAANEAAAGDARAMAVLRSWE
mmetsp:Transcript_69393/g.136172  ORF Transcript_69393/g.136172 Transcript_69393/m.136172 type:complete len:224 (-) Transcript_69393:23-694(-)